VVRRWLVSIRRTAIPNALLAPTRTTSFLPLVTAAYSRFRWSMGKMLAGGGLLGFGAFEAVHLGISALSELFENKNAEAMEKIAVALKGIRKEAVASIIPFERLTGFMDAAAKGDITGDRGKKILEAIDAQQQSISKKRNDAINKTAKMTPAAQVESAIKTPEGRRLFFRLYEDESKKFAGLNVADPNVLATEIEKGARKRMEKSPELTDIISNTELEAGQLRDLEKRRADILKKSGRDPKIFGPEANPFLAPMKGGGGMTDPLGFSRGIQEAALEGGEGAATKDEQKKQTSIQERTLGALERIAGVSGGGGGAVWG
jgi:hypothetical protein